MDETQERTLITRLQAGDQSAFSDLFEAYNRRIIGLALHFLRNEELALDVAQDVFMRAYQELPNWRGEARFGTWLYRTTVNVCFEKLRAEDKQRKIKDTLPARDLGESPEVSMINDESLRAIEDAIQQLPPRQQTVFVLKHYHDLRFSDIASILDLTEGGAKANYHKALVALRERIQDSKVTVQSPKAKDGKGTDQ